MDVETEQVILPSASNQAANTGKKRKRSSASDNLQKTSNDNSSNNKKKAKEPANKKRKKTNPDESSEISGEPSYLLEISGVQHKIIGDRIFRIVVTFDDHEPWVLPFCLCYARLDRIEIPLCSLVWHSLPKTGNGRQVEVCLNRLYLGYRLSLTSLLPFFNLYAVEVCGAVACRLPSVGYPSQGTGKGDERAGREPSHRSRSQ